MNSYHPHKIIVVFALGFREFLDQYREIWSLAAHSYFLEFSSMILAQLAHVGGFGSAGMTFFSNIQIFAEACLNLLMKG